MPTPIPNIWQLQSKGDVDGLIAALRHTESSVRRGAAAALRALGAWQAVPALEGALSVESDWQAHAAMVAAIQYLDRDIHIETMIKNRDVHGLSKMLNSPKVEDILIACDALSSIGDRQVVEPLVMVFRNPLLPNRARLAAAEALLKLESAPAVVTLLGALRKENWQVRRNAAAVLGQLQAFWSTEALIKVLGDPHPLVQKTAAAALRRFGTPEALAAAEAFDAAQQRRAIREGPPEDLIGGATGPGGHPRLAETSRRSPGSTGRLPTPAESPTVPAQTVPVRPMPTQPATSIETPAAPVPPVPVTPPTSESPAAVPIEPVAAPLPPQIGSDGHLKPDI